MATPKRAEHIRDHVSMSELLASCVAAQTLSTPPRIRPEREEEGLEGPDGGLRPQDVRDARDEAA
ncbi:hypothetical protein [Streptomyces sp. NPDC058664]|uniref:hypothetical protein n=1 Tax=unclassified Streptomyces TaxID=2593676 RepID=UPI003669DA70